MEIKKEVRIGTVLVFLAFYVFLVMQFSKVFIYYDDYGYLSLSYGNTIPDVVGSQYQLSQLLTFMGKHYIYSNGRLFYLFLFPFLYMLGGITAVQAFMASCVLAILLLSYYIVMRCAKPEGWRPMLLAGFICLLYGTIGILIQRLGSYWFAASFLYVTPAVVFLILAVFYYETLEGTAETSKKAACVVLAFFAAFSQEEWLVAVIGFILMIIAFKIWKKHRVDAWDFGTLLAAAVGALPILTSPAVKMRLDQNSGFSNLPFIQKILTNLRNIMNLFFSPDNQNYLAILLTALLALGIHMAVKKTKYRLMYLLYAVLTVAVSGYLFLKVNRKILAPGGHCELMVWILFLYLIVTAVLIIQVLYDRNQVLLGMIFLSAILTLACLVMVPELPQRVLLPFIYLSYTLLGYLFCVILLERRSLVWGILGAAFLAVISVPNLEKIYRGYRVNYEVHQYNDAKIREAVEKSRSGGEKLQKIDLYRNLDALCSCGMVYEESFSFMISWMAEYYDLPYDVELNYESITNLETWFQEMEQGKH